jgi:hypothetical protein
MVLLAFGVYYDLVGYHLEFGVGKQIYLILDHVRFGIIDARLFVRDFNVFYLLSTSPSELQQYFPSYGWVVYVVGLLVRYVLPVTFIFLAIRWLLRRRFGLERVLRFYFKGLNVLILFITTLIISLGLYFIFRDIGDHFLFQLALVRVFLIINVAAVLIVSVLNREALYERLKDFLFETGSPYPLAITRILFFGYLAALYALYFLQFGNTIGELEKQALPGIGWLIELLPVSPTIYRIACWTGIFVTLMVAIGYRTRFFLVVNSLIVFYVVASPNFFGKLWHEQIIIWISWILACSPCYQVLSIDSLSKTNLNKQQDPSNSYHVRMIWLQFGIIYFFAGFYKLWLCGFDWALSDSMINQVQIEWFEHYDKVSDWRLDKFPIFLKVSGLAVIIFELFYGLLLFHRHWRWISVIGGLIMHNVLLKLLYIGFLIKLQVFYIVFIPWDKVLRKDGRSGLREDSVPDRPRLDTWAMIIPAIIVAMNFVYGVFNINSYPFSIYPVYAEIIPDNVSYFDYRVLDKGLEQIEEREEGKNARFRWENYSRGEYHIIRTRQAGLGLDSAAVRTQWRRWQLEIPSLAQIDSVDVFVVERPLDPEKSDIRISEEYLMTISTK